MAECCQWAIIAAVENGWDKYQVTLAEIKQEEVDRGVREMLKGLGYE